MKTRNESIIAQVKRDRAARRAVAIELGLPKETAKVHKTSKRDRASRKQVSNTVRGGYEQ